MIMLSVFLHVVLCRGEAGKMSKVMVAMSGGVDSSVAALLLNEQGYDCFGATMRLFADVCSPDDESVDDARDAAMQIGIPFQVYDFTDAFSLHVINNFTNAYMNGKTPNPCIDCNRHIKFGCFYDAAGEYGADFVATGHYARIVCENGRYLLKKGADRSKDQSYVLYTLTQEKLARTLFPLGGLTKPDVRGIALDNGFGNAGKSESQDICFIPDGDYAGFLERSADFALAPGSFVDVDGNIVGEHKGLHRYTIGQRRGLGISAGESLYVVSVDPESNTVTVGNRDSVFSRALQARDINLIAVDRIDAPLRVSAKIRYRQTEQPATVRQLDDDLLHVEFDEPQRAITKGQAVVLYDGDIVVGGGTIC